MRVPEEASRLPLYEGSVKCQTSGVSKGVCNLTHGGFDSPREPAHNSHMSRATQKKSPAERRKKSRGSSKRPQGTKASRAAKKATVAPRAPEAGPAGDECCQCSKGIRGDDRALFVEEELGRIFCSEECIAEFFAPDVERLEKEYHRHTSASDLSGDERAQLAHLRWITLQEPDECWREKTLSGDYRYTLMSEFQPGNRRVWSICICLFLRGEPSFLFLAFATKNAAMVNHYRRGERVDWESLKGSDKKGEQSDQEDGSEGPAPEHSDRLADAWTENETFLAQVTQERSEDDIQPNEYELYQSCLEETLEVPDEVWSVRSDVASESKSAQDGPEPQETHESSDANDSADSAESSDSSESAEVDGPRLYHFIRYYSDETPGHWYVIMARETDNEEQIEILDAFPTRDAQLVDRYRRGVQEVGQVSEQRASQRVVH